MPSLAIGQITVAHLQCIQGNDGRSRRYMYLLRSSSQGLDPPALVSAGLQVEGTLVLQPSPVASDAADLLAVVVWRGVGERGDGGIDAVALYAVEEGRVFLF